MNQEPNIILCRKRQTKRYLVDPASSYMLVSKAKPCKCKYELIENDTAKGSLNQSWFTWSCGDPVGKWITVENLELIHAKGADFGRRAFIGVASAGGRQVAVDSC